MCLSYYPTENIDGFITAMIYNFIKKLAAMRAFIGRFSMKKPPLEAVE